MKVVTGKMRIIKISKTGEVTLSFVSSNFGSILVSQVDNNMLTLFIRSQSQTKKLDFNITSKSPTL